MFPDCSGHGPQSHPEWSKTCADNRQSSHVKRWIAMFIPSQGRVPVSRAREVLPNGSTMLLRLQFFRTGDCEHWSWNYLLFFFFWRERDLPKVSWKGNSAAPGLANQVTLCIMTSCSIPEHPSQPFLDQILCEHSGGLVRKAAKQALGVIRNWSIGSDTCQPLSGVQMT